LIISGGSSIYPRVVEEVLLAHPDVAEVSVIGRAHLDWGEEITALLLKKLVVGFKVRCLTFTEKTYRPI
jgi:long-chain acyl-CoA synthetase